MKQIEILIDGKKQEFKDLNAKSLIVNVDGKKLLDFEERGIKFTDKEIESMKSILEDKDIFADNEDELEELQKQKLKIGTDSIVLGRLFLNCYGILSLNYHLLMGETTEEDYSKKLKNFLENFGYIDHLRQQVGDYGDGEIFGSGYAGERVKKVVNNNRDKMVELITLFFKLFGETD